MYKYWLKGFTIAIVFNDKNTLDADIPSMSLT